VDLFVDDGRSCRLDRSGRYSGPETFAPWTTDLFYFVATHLPAQSSFGMVTPGELRVQWLAIPMACAHGGNLPFLISFRWRLSSRISASTPRTGRFARSICGLSAIHHSIGDGLGGRIALALRDILLTRGLSYPMTIFGFRSHVGRLFVFVSFHAVRHTDFRRGDLAGAVLRDRALPTGITRRIRRRWIQLRHPSPLIDRCRNYLSKTLPKRYGLVGGSVRKASSRSARAVQRDRRSRGELRQRHIAWRSRRSRRLTSPTALMTGPSYSRSRTRRTVSVRSHVRIVGWLFCQQA